jgi:hypothetical protein
VLQFSPLVHWPSPQFAEQSLSVALAQPGGQHPSLSMQVVTALWAHCAVQVAAVPVSISTLHALA